MSFLLSLYLLITIVICFVKLKWGIALYLAYFLLVPYFSFFGFGINLFSIVLLCAYLYKYGTKNLIFSPLKPFLLFFLFSLLIIPFQDGVPIMTQLDTFRGNFLNTIIFPFILLNVVAREKNSLKLYVNVLIASICIACVYSLVLIPLKGVNPYISSILALSDKEFNEVYALAESGGRVFGRISGVFKHPMTNGLFLGLSFLFLLIQTQIIKSKNTIINYILFVLVFIVLNLIGVRSVIVSVIITLLLYLVYKRQWKVFFYGLAGLFLCLIVLLQLPGMDTFVFSIFQESAKDEVGGSSVDMRIEQLEGCFRIVQDEWLFGKGYGWTAYYFNTIGNHPVVLAFESLIFVIICNSGIFGFFIWAIFISSYYFTSKTSFGNRGAFYLLLLLIFYLLYSTITGEYGYMQVFLIFYILIWLQFKALVNKSKKKNTYE